MALPRADPGTDALVGARESRCVSLPVDREKQGVSPLSSHPKSTPSATRRARRAADRRAAAATHQAASPRRTRSPILLITAIIGGIGIVVIGALILLGGTASKPTIATLTTPVTPTPVALAEGRSIGKADAPVSLEVWTDFQCPICGQYARTVEPALMSKYVASGILRIVHHDAAFQGAKSSATYDESVEAAAGARCAADQNAYWPFQDWAFANQSGENQGAFAAARLTSIASAAGLDITAWKTCVATGQQQTAARAETSQALAGGVNATPTMSINGQVIVGLRSVPDLSALIDAAAAAKGG